MTYRVELMDRAARDLEDLFQTINAETSAQAYAWFNRLERLIRSLEEQPARGSIIQEDARLRHVLHGRRPHVYRVIYEIDKRHDVVRVLHIRHARRDAFGVHEDDGPSSP